MNKFLIPFFFMSASFAQILTPIGDYKTGLFMQSAAEIPAYDESTQRLFVVNSSEKTVDVLDLSVPNAPRKIGNLDISQVDANAILPNSVAAHNGLVAVAIEHDSKSKDGFIGLFKASNLSHLKTLRAGVVPDMIVFSQDGTKILTANEGEPNASYSKDSEGSITLVNISESDTIATQINFNAFDAQKSALQAKGVRISGPHGNVTVSQDLEPAYITLNADGSKAWVSLQENNAMAIIDLNTKKVAGIVSLGKRDFSLAGYGLDPIADGKAKIANYPLKGLYMPDGLASMEYEGKTYIFSANEGEGRDFNIAHEELASEANCLILNYVWSGECLEKVWTDEGNISDLKIDSADFSAEDLLALEPLSTLMVSTTEGDTDGDGQVEEIVIFGTRSFAVWDEEGKLLWDSGDAFEVITAAKFPNNFNATSDKNGIDERSDDKGPEPEGIAIGKVGDQTYAFIALERIGGIMIYDVTNPREPVFLEYFSDRDFSSNSDSKLVNTQLAPEGIKFIPASHSPNNRNLLVVSYEVSGNTRIYEVPTPISSIEKMHLGNSQIFWRSGQGLDISSLKGSVGIKVYSMRGQLITSIHTENNFISVHDLINNQKGSFMIRIESNHEQKIFSIVNQ